MVTVMSPPEQRVILYDISWETYEHLLADRVDQPTPRFFYDRGTLEMLVNLSTEHEETKHMLTMIVETIAVERGMDIRVVGSMTFKREDLARGFEADVAFYIQSLPHVRGRKKIDPTVDPPPDLVIEIDVSRQSLNKLPIYAGFGVPEIWRAREGVVTVYIRDDGADGYVADAPSLALPPLTGEILTQLLAESANMGRVSWVRSIQAWAQGGA
jgi:Uma2 family endonuclease